MKTLLAVAAALAMAGVGQGRAVAADIHPALDTQVGCTPAKGVIRFKTEGAYEAGGPKSGPRLLTGTHTRIWSCKVGSRLLVVKYYVGAPTSMCSATTDGYVSAWVDGVKLVDMATAGDANRCFSYKDYSALVSVSLSAKGRFETCAQRGPDDKTECQSQNLLAGKRAVDPRYVAPGVRTAPALVLRHSGARFCSRLIPQLRPYPQGRKVDQTFAAQTLPGATVWEGWVRADTPSVRFRADIDNDGRVDIVTSATAMRRHGHEWGRISWQAKFGRTFVARELPRSVSDLPALPEKDSYVAFSTRPVRIEGRAYLYLLRQNVGESADDIDVEAVYGASRDGKDQITRGLLELHSDGSTTLACGWGPKLRPEEFL